MELLRSTAERREASNRTYAGPLPDVIGEASRSRFPIPGRQSCAQLSFLGKNGTTPVSTTTGVMRLDRTCRARALAGCRMAKVPASAVTARFGAIAKPLADARGSVRSHDGVPFGPGVVAPNGTEPHGQRPRRGEPGNRLACRGAPGTATLCHRFAPAAARPGRRQTSRRRGKWQHDKGALSDHGRSCAPSGPIRADSRINGCGATRVRSTRRCGSFPGRRLAHEAGRLGRAARPTLRAVSARLV
jgi:hypothetical protein